MKKISTLLLALTLVLSVTAAPINLPTDLSKKQATSKMQVAKDKAKFASVKEGASFAKEAVKKVAPVRKAAQAAGAPVVAQAAYWGTYTKIVGDFYISFFDADDAWVGAISIVAPDKEHIAGTFTVSSESQWVYAVGDTADVTSASLTITGIRFDGSDPVYQFTGTLVDAQGRQIQLNNEISIYVAYDYYNSRMYSSYMQACQLYQDQDYCEMAKDYADYMIDLQDITIQETGVTLELEFDCYDKTIYDNYNTTDFSAKNDTFGISLSFLTTNLEKTTYQQDALDLTYCYLIDYRGAEPVKLAFESISADVDFSDNGDTIYVNIEEALTKEGDRANITLKYFTPSAQRTVDLGEFNGTIIDHTSTTYPYFFVRAFNNDTTKALQVSINSDEIFGNFDKNVIDLKPDSYGYYTYVLVIEGTDTTAATTFYDATVSIVREQPTVAKATISLLSKDLVQYNAVVYFTVAHEPTGVVIPVEFDEIPSLFFGDDLYNGDDYDKYFVLSDKNDEYSFSAVIVADTVHNDTTYLRGSFYENGYTFLEHFTATDTTIFNVGNVSLSVAKDADTTFFVLDYLAFETGDLYRLSCKYYIPQAVDTVRFVAEKGQSVDFVYSSGEAFIQAKKSAPADSIYLVSLYFSGINDLYGTFTANDLYQEDYSIAHVDGTDTTKVVFLTADIKITSVDATTAHAAIYAQGRDNVIYDFSFDFTVRDNFGDDSENALNLTFAHDQFMLSSTTPYDTIYAYDGTYMLSARFLTNAATLDNGTYTIDDVLAYNHISASHGSVLFYDKTYGTYTDLTGAFVVKNLNSSTYAYEEVWYLVSGTATVTDTQIVIEAVNSKGNQVNITINRQEETALEELLLNGAAPRKLIDNGRVVIIRDGKAFGIDGRRIR